MNARMTRNELLQSAAEEAFNNSRALLEESKILFGNGRWARSFALSVTAAEEYVKSFEYKCEQAHFRIPPVPKKPHIRSDKQGSRC